MSAHARSVSLGFYVALADESWICESGAPPFANASGSVVRVFFCCGGVIGVPASPPPSAARSIRFFDALHHLVLVLVPESWVLLDTSLGLRSCTPFLGHDR